jgi:hypothetical protein
LHLQPSDDIRECLGQNTLKRNFVFHQLFLDLLLKERESLRRGKKSLGTLKSGSTHIALAVQYKPPAGT